MTDHLPAQVVSDLEAGLLESAQALAAQAHLAECSRCLDTRTALRTVRARLAADDPGPMPADVAARLDRALAAAAQPPGALRPATATAGPDRAAARRRFARARGLVPGLLAAAAVAGVVAVGAGAVANLAARNQATNTTGAAAGDSPDQPRLEGQTGGQPAAPGGGAVAPDAQTASAGTRSGAGPESIAGAAAPVPVRYSERDYAGQLALAVQDGARLPGASAPPRADAEAQAPRKADPNDPATRLADPAALAQCLQALGAPGRARSVELARYRGSPAAVIVLVVPGRPDLLDVRVVRPTCAEGDAQELDAARVPAGLPSSNP